MRHIASLLLAGGLLLLAGSLAAQTLYNQGATIFVTPGTTFTVQGGYQQTAGATLQTGGTTKVTGNVQSAAGSILDLSAGELEVTGNVTNAGTTTSTPTGTLRLTGTANQTVDVQGGTVGRLIVSQGGAGTQVDVPTDLTVTGGVTLTGGKVRTTATSAVVLPTGAPVTGEATGRYVKGNLRVTKPAVAGTTAVDFGNGAILNPNGNTLGTVTVNRAAGLHQADVTYGQHPTRASLTSIDRIWTIAPQTQPATGQPAALTMTWLPDDDNGLNFTETVAGRRPAAPAAWTLLGSPQSAFGRTLTVSAAAFSEWTVFADAVDVLPVTLVSFSATRVGTAARLTWLTASERNSDYFEVEVSPTGHDFRALASIGRVAAQGTSASRHEYAATDADLLRYGTRVVYYRLRMTDRDGSVATSEVRALSLGGAPTTPATLAATVWPNPSAAESQVQVQLSLPTADPVELTLFDAVGRLVRQATLTPAAAGELRAAVPGTEAGAPLATGTYVLRARQGTARTTLRLLRE